MSLGLTIKILATLIELMLPYILTHILKNVVGTGSVAKILMWGALMLACAALACIGNVVANRMAAKVSCVFSERMRKELFKRTMTLSAAQVDRFSIPSLESRITTDTYNVHHFVGMVQRMGVRAPILLIGGIGITLFLDTALSLVMISLIPIIFLTVFLISRKGIPLYTKVQKANDSMVRVVREDTQGIRVIKALSKNEYENLRFEEKNENLSKTERHAGIIMGSVNPIMTLLMNLGIVAVIVVAALRVSGLESDPETVIAFIQYFTLISMAMMFLSRIFIMFTKCVASANRISEVISTPEDMSLCESDEPFDKSAALIEFRDVDFSYDGIHSHLKDISFELSEGQSLGIIGATGSGKSTIVNILLHFYDTTSGGVYIFGKNIRSISNEELRGMLGVALQNDFLYADTIEENIKFGREISHGQVVRAAQIAQAYDFISAFPDGFSHILAQKGTNISGGQKQRILIARAIAASPSILILDDSSSALDYKTDANLRAALKESLAGSTVITVAQRVSSVKDCDLILVMDRGRIIGKGTHGMLLESCPEYKEISDSQMGGSFVE